MQIVYKKGDATAPTESGFKIIPHVSNNLGAWGAGFVLALSKRWPQPEQQYREWAEGKHGKFALGLVQYVPVTDDILVANMIGQEGIGWNDGVPPIRYDAVEKCLDDVAVVAKLKNATITAPRFGSNLAGGSWEEIEKIIIKTLISKNIPVVIYDL